METIILHRSILWASGLFCGFILDALLGDPRWLPHPIVLFGNCISLGEKRLNSGSKRTLKGAFLSIFLILIVFAFFQLVFLTISKFQFFEFAFITIFSFYGLANRSLISEVLMVDSKLTNEGLDSGRKQLANIVGRETKNLTERNIRIAALETLSENLSDGVIAPMFYFALGGIPAMFAYKMINTLDSMIGYKNERVKYFGFFAAKIDDMANFIPSRITAFLIAIVSFKWRSFIFILKYGNKHSSPNSGYPESALAGVLDCRFGGSNLYQGQLVDKPYIGLNDREISTSDIHKAVRLNFKVSITFLIIVELLLGIFFI